MAIKTARANAHFLVASFLIFHSPSCTVFTQCKFCLFTKSDSRDIEKIISDHFYFVKFRQDESQKKTKKNRVCFQTRLGVILFVATTGRTSGEKAPLRGELRNDRTERHARLGEGVHRQRGAKRHLADTALAGAGFHGREHHPRHAGRP
jgi:hypothetical protein